MDGRHVFCMEGAQRSADDAAPVAACMQGVTDRASACSDPERAPQIGAAPVAPCARDTTLRGLQSASVGNLLLLRSGA